MLILLGLTIAIIAKFPEFIAKDFSAQAQGTDFRLFMASTHAFQAHADAYALGTGAWQNMNPPIWFVPFTLLASLPLGTAQVIWRAASLLVAAWSVVWLCRRYSPDRLDERVLVLVALTPVWTTVWEGQVYLMLLGVATAAWVLIEDGHDNRAGLALGLLSALKPNLIVWPILLFIGGKRRPALIAGCWALAFSLVAVLAFGTKPTLEWLTLARSGTSGLEWHAENASLFGLASRSGFRSLALPVSLATLGAAALWAWRRPLAASQLSILGIGAALLAAPLSWVGYLVLFFPAIIKSAAKGWHSVEKLALVALLVPPWVVPRAQPFTDIYFVPLLLLATRPLLAQAYSRWPTFLRPLLLGHPADSSV